MKKRYASIWFPYLTTDWQSKRQPALRDTPFVFAHPVQGRMLISAANAAAEKHAVVQGMVVADAKAFLPSLEVLDERIGFQEKLLKAIGLWCIRFTPIVALDEPDGLILDISGCAHLWGGEEKYLQHIISRFSQYGYQARMAIADSIGAAWAVTRYGKSNSIVESNTQLEALLNLPPMALRLEVPIVERMYRLGLKKIKSFAGMPRSVLRRRFGDHTVLRLAQAIGSEDEFILPLKPIAPYEERLPCLEPINTDKGIEIAIEKLLEALCGRLANEGKGIREASLIGHRLDGKVEQISIGTSRSTAHIPHLFKLFALKISQIEPALGIELFILQAHKVEDAEANQEILWDTRTGLEDSNLTELLDRLKNRDTACEIFRYFPDQHYWPERSMRQVSSIIEKAGFDWPLDRPRPTRLLARPERIHVTAPIPDYPPMVFQYKGVRHPIRKADGPERIEREWWIDPGEHRDYYAVEDDQGQRYWLYRSGHYGDKESDEWFIHGFFA